MNRPLGAHLYGEKVLEIKTAPTDGSGRFTGYLSTWTVDRDNERFAKGAFQRSIVEWLTAGDTPPILYSHDRTDPANVVGVVESMREDAEGLLIEGRLNLRAERAQRVYEAMLGGALKSLSVGFIGHEWEYEGDVRTFTRAEILEASLTPVPANPGARVLAVKGRSRDELETYRERIAALEVKTRDPLAQARAELLADVRSERLEQERIVRLAEINGERARRMAHGMTLQEEQDAEEERYAREVRALHEREVERAREAEQRAVVEDARRTEGRVPWAV